MIRFILALILAYAAIAQCASAQTGIPPVGDYTVEDLDKKILPINHHAQEALFSDSAWVKSPAFCARDEECIVATDGNVVIIKSKQPWLKVGYVIKRAFSTLDEDALFAQPCEVETWLYSCGMHYTDEYYRQLFYRVDYIFNETVRNRPK